MTDPVQNAVAAQPFQVTTTDILGDIETRITIANKKHGDWRDYNEKLISDAISNEFNEYLIAWASRSVTGRHGQIDELYDLATVAVKGIRRLHAIVETQKRAQHE